MVCAAGSTPAGGTHTTAVENEEDTAMSTDTAVSAAATETTTENPAETDETTAPTWSERARQAAATRTANAALRARLDARSTWWRNRRGLVPLLLTAGFAGTGATGALVATHAEQVSALAAAPATGAVALAGSWLVWKRTSQNLPSGMGTRMKTGLAAGCAWCLALPLAGADSVGMWLGLGLGAAALSARWWQRLRPGYPDTPQPVPEPVPVPGAESELPDGHDIIELWNTNIAGHRQGCLRGSEIGPARRIDNGRAFDVQLNPAEHTIDTARTMHTRIAGALRTHPSKIVIEPATAATDDDVDVSRMELRVIDASPVVDGVDYQGPRIVTDDDGTHILLGPHADGDGEAAFTVLQEDSMRSGFLFGGSGGGKSRLLELIAIALREIGIEVWFLDPQEGQSSPALADHADWYLPGIGDETDEDRETGHVEDLLDALQGALRYRSRKLRSQGKKGFTHSAEMPGVMVIIDEASDVFEMKRPGTSITYGTLFGPLAKKIRKVGFGFLFVGHIYTLPTFGNSKMLRSSVTMSNIIALRTTEKSDATLLPAGMPDPTTLPELPGFGYIKSAASDRAAPFRAEYVRDPEPWLAARPARGVDTGTANGAGHCYARRVEIAAEQQRRQEAQLAALENGDFDALDEFDEPDEDTAPISTGGTVLTLPSLTGGTINSGRQAAAGRDEFGGSLSHRHQQILDLLGMYGQLSTDQLAEEIGVSAVTVRKRLRVLGESGQVRTSERGVHALGR